jgi:DNA repair protein RecN (Recombination protein N)
MGTAMMAITTLGNGDGIRSPDWVGAIITRPQCVRKGPLHGTGIDRRMPLMLRELSVQNLAVIEDVRVELQPGFCAWTGETGAGKSLLLGALGLLLGERGSADLIRAGADELRVTGRFELTSPGLREAAAAVLDGPPEGDEVILARRVSRAGRSAAYVNDSPVSLPLLRRLGEVLVDIHGQRENNTLLQPAYQLELLDAFGKLGGPRREYLDLAAEVRALRRRHAELAAAREQRQRELSLVRFEREELDNADLKPGEAVELARERELLVNARSLVEFAGGGAARLYDDEGSVVEQLGKLRHEAEGWAALDPRLAEVAKRLEGLVPEVQDLAETFRDLAERFEVDPERLDEVEKRLQQIRRLEAKYRKPADELAAYRATLEEQEQRLQKQEDDLGGVEAEAKSAFARLKEAAAALSKARAKVAKKLAAEAQKHLADLGMPDAKLDATLKAVPLGDDPLTGDLPAAGAEALELLLTANPGEPARPLRKVASGGELARTMLALKSVLAAHDPVGTLVFDEIDANVGGRLGDVLGQKLAALGEARQVICVTHLPQVASLARHQWTIRKRTTGKRTATTIAPLAGDEERIDELASMMRGESRGETTRREAAAMLEAGRKKWGA